MNIPPVLVIAIGNPSRGDDALGPLLLRKIESLIADAGLQADIELLEDFQLQVEHAADLQGRELVLFADAGMNTPPPYLFRRIQARAGRPLLSHALPPEDVLAAFMQVYRQPPPPSFLLCISGAHFALGEPLSAPAAGNLAAACDFTRRLLMAADLASWERLAGTPVAAP